MICPQNLQKMNKYSQQEFEQKARTDFNSVYGIHPCDCGLNNSNRVRYFNRSNYIVVCLIDCGCNIADAIIDADLTFYMGEDEGISL